jgi:hypothetical protein
MPRLFLAMDQVHWAIGLRSWLFLLSFVFFFLSLRKKLVNLVEFMT